EVEALDRALAPEAGLRALAGDVGAVGLQVEVDGLCHVDASVSFWSMRPRASRARGVPPQNGAPTAVWEGSDRKTTIGSSDGRWFFRRSKFDRRIAQQLNVLRLWAQPNGRELPISIGTALALGSVRCRCYPNHSKPLVTPRSRSAAGSSTPAQR